MVMVKAKGIDCNVGEDGEKKVCGGNGPLEWDQSRFAKNDVIIFDG